MCQGQLYSFSTTSITLLQKKKKETKQNTELSWYVNMNQRRHRKSYAF